MFELPFDKIVERIVSETSLSRSAVLALVEQKKEELQGLVSEEGAAFIVANEKGVSFIPSKSEDYIKIGGIISGMKMVNTLGRVVACFPVNEFESKGRKGAVGSFLLGDDSGVIRVVLWNELTRLISENKISKGDTLKVVNAYSRSNQDKTELHISVHSRLSLNPENVSLPDVSTFGGKSSSSSDDSLLGSFTYIFPQVRFFDVCSSCNKRVTEGKCLVHSSSPVKKSMVLSISLDNGSGSFRCIFFGDSASSLFSASIDALFSEFEADESFKVRLENLRKVLLGRLVLVSGRLQSSSFSGRDELIVRSLDMHPDPVAVSKSLFSELI